MRVAIDIRRARDFGVGTYTRNIVRTLSRLDTADQFTLLGAPDAYATLGPLPENFSHAGFRSGPLRWRNYFDLRPILLHHRIELIHIPHLFWIPRSLPCPYVMTVHDLVEYLSPVRPERGWRRNLHLAFTRRALHGARKVLAVSQSTKADILRMFGLPEEQVAVVYNAIDERFLQGHTTPQDRQFIAERYQVNYPFLLYAGNIKPHKNVLRLIEAFSALKQMLAKDGQCPDLKLIIIGDELSKHPDLRRTVIKSRVQNDVRFLGFVPIETLRIFYDIAKIFVFPSLYEGFGLPPLEAMAHGTPIVCSNTTSLPEVVGSAAVLVNPENVFEISRALHRVLVDTQLRDRLKESSVQQAKKYSWEKSTRQIMEIYRAAVDLG